MVFEGAKIDGSQNVGLEISAMPIIAEAGVIDFNEEEKKKTVQGNTGLLGSVSGSVVSNHTIKGESQSYSK